MRIFVIVIAAFAVGGCAVGPGPAGPARGVSSISPPDPGTTPGPTPAPSTSAGAPAPGTPTPSRSLNVLPPGTKVPALTGWRLSKAHTQLTSMGFAAQSIRATDGSDQNRSVFNYDNWIVNAQTPSPGTVADAHTYVTLTVTKPTDGRGDRTAKPGVVPNVTCKELDGAASLLRTAGFTTIGTVDGTGERRSVIVYQNWVVIAQSSPAGSTPSTSTRIELTVVKYGESTGSSGCRS